MRLKHQPGSIWTGEHERSLCGDGRRSWHRPRLVERRLGDGDNVVATELGLAASRVSVKLDL
jgi:hypothetical protein